MLSTMTGMSTECGITNKENTCDKRGNVVDANAVQRKVDKEAAEPGAKLGVEINSEEGNNDNGTMRKQKRKLSKLRMQKRKEMINIWA